MEIDFSYDPNLKKIVSNLVNMSDLLGFFPELQQLYFRSVRRGISGMPKIETFYNVFAYELLRKSEIAVFLSYVTQIVQIVGIPQIPLILGAANLGGIFRESRFCADQGGNASGVLETVWKRSFGERNAEISGRIGFPEFEGSLFLL